MVPAAANVEFMQEHAGRVFRKPYVVRKSREKWSSEEHERFVEAVDRFGRSWSSIVDHIGTRSVAQVRSHAQKYFLKLQHQGKANAVPPPRPKRRSTKPYPVQQKADYSADQAVAQARSPAPESASAGCGSGDSSEGHASNAGSATSNFYGQDESSETSMHIPPVKDLLRPGAQAPSLCKLEAGSASDLPPSDVSRLHRALNVVLQRPYIPSQQMAEGAGDYASQRAALVARLNQLKSQLDSKPSAPLPAGRQLGSVAPSCLSSLQSPQLDVAPAALQTGTAITHGIVGHQLPLPALDATCFAQQPWASSMASAGPLHPDQFLRYPMTPLYTTAAAQELTSTTAPPSGLAGLPDQSLPGPPELGCSLPAAAPARQHSPLQMPFSHSIWHGQTAPSIAKPATVSQPLSEAIGVPCSWYQISEQAASGSLTNHGSAVADYESPDKCTSALPRVKETVTSTDPLLLEGPVEEASRMLRPPSFLCGLDLEGFDPWTLDSVAAFSSLDGSSCSESSVADFDPTAWLQL